MKLWEELKRRNVVKVAIAYLALAWLVIQVTAIAVPSLDLPIVMNKVVFFVGLIAFPFVIFFAWVFEFTSEGLKKTANVESTQSINNMTGRKLDFLIIGLLIFALIFVLWNKPEQPQNSAAPTELSIAVIPFINMSSQSENEFFAAGVHEEVLTKLSFIKNIKVASRTSTLKYLNSTMSIRDIGRELGVKYVVEGSVRRMNKFVRVTAQLIDSHTDTHVWASNFDRKLEDIFAVQSAIAGEISNAIHVELAPSTVSNLTGMGTHSVKAYDLYVQANTIEASERETEQSLQRTYDLLKASISHDPDYAEAWGLLNEICDHMLRNMEFNGWYKNDPELYQALVDESNHALQKAIILGPEKLDTLLAQASYSVPETDDPNYRFNRKQYLDKAIELYPDAAMPWYVLGWWYYWFKDFEAADNAFKKAVEKEPFNARILNGALNYYNTHTLGGEFADELYKRLESSLGGVSEEEKIVATWNKFVNNPTNGDLFKNVDKSTYVFKNPFYVVDFASIFQLPIEVYEVRNQEIVDSNFSAEGDRARHININLLLLSHYSLTNQTEKTQRIADYLMQTSNNKWKINENSYLARQTILANVTAGNIEKAQELTNNLIANTSTTFDPYGYDGIISMSYIDVDKAVEMLFNQGNRAVTWRGFDILPVNTILHQQILSHPKVVDFYKRNEKWASYLAERIPAYQ